jgi:hypothetical protein
MSAYQQLLNQLLYIEAFPSYTIFSRAAQESKRVSKRILKKSEIIFGDGCINAGQLRANGLE